ncbi:MAG: hypothetical protein AB9882_03370 [Ignavibacteriaceae bacterium]
MSKSYLIIIPLILIIYGCELFTARNPEPPNEPRSNFQPALSSEIVLKNLVNSLSDKNTQNYLSCLTGSSFSKLNYSFIPSAEAISKFPIFSEDWNLLNEEQYLNNIIAKMPEDIPITLSFQDTLRTIQGDSVFYSAKYSLSVPHNDVNIPNNFQGELKFKLIRDSQNIWSIFFWQDIKTSANPSWSELKGVFY